MRFGVEVLAANLYECVLHSIYRTGAMSSNYLSCYPLICRKKTLRPRTSSNFTDLYIITLPRIPGEVDTEDRGYIYMQITMEAVFAVLLAGMGGFIAIPELCESSVGIVELFPNRIHQYLYYPQFKAMMSDRKTWLQYRLNTSGKCFKRKQFIHSRIAELQVSMAVYFLYRNSANDDLIDLRVLN